MYDFFLIFHLFERACVIDIEKSRDASFRFSFCLNFEGVCYVCQNRAATASRNIGKNSKETREDSGYSVTEKPAATEAAVAAAAVMAAGVAEEAAKARETLRHSRMKC